MTKSAPNTIASKKALRTELESIREEGMAVNDEELAPGVHSIAAPIRSRSGEVVAAIDMTAHESMITVEELGVSLSPHLIAAAARVSARLGYRRADQRG